jgi:hypothetical protein
MKIGATINTNFSVIRLTVNFPAIAPGTPYTATLLNQRTKRLVYSFTGNTYWHPHIIRTVWTTEWIKSGGDFFTAAVMLNDHLETVIKNYAYLRDENDAEKAYQWVEQQIKG